MTGRGKHGNLLTNSDGTTPEGNENLTEDDPAKVSSRLSEIDHKAFTEEVEGDREHQEPPKVTSLSDSVTDNEQPDTRDNVEDTGDVTSNRDGGTENDLEVRGEVVIPTVVCNLIGEIEQTGPDNTTREDNPIRNERPRGREPFGEDEKDQEDKTDDKHSNDVILTPFVGGRGSDGEREKEEDETGSEEEDTED